MLLDPSSCSTIAQSWFVYGNATRLRGNRIGFGLVMFGAVMRSIWRGGCGRIDDCIQRYKLKGQNTLRAPHRLHLYRPLASFCSCWSVKLRAYKSLRWDVWLFWLLSSSSRLLFMWSLFIKASLFLAVITWWVSGRWLEVMWGMAGRSS